MKYYLRETNGGALSLSTNIKFLSAYEGNAVPEYINLDVPDIFYIDNSEWQELPIYLTIFDLNGNEDIKSVKYEIKRTFDGCEGNCVFDPNCNDPINDSNFQSDETWNFEFIEYMDEGFKYAVLMFMRPLDGSGYSDENNQFAEEDCGRTGVFDIRFIIEDNTGNIVIKEISNIGIIAP